jgi:hypothetical protein
MLRHSLPPSPAKNLGECSRRRFVASIPIELSMPFSSLTIRKPFSG